MGCDIHIVIENREPDSREWVGVWCSDITPGIRGRAKIGRRDYDFFSEVASVRGHSPTSSYPQNLPKDVSRLAWLRYMRAPTDHHNVSHMTTGEFVGAWLRANPADPDVRPEHATYDLLQIDCDPDDGDWRVVFWFDN